MEDPVSDGVNLSDLQAGREKFEPDPDLQDWQNRVLEEHWELDTKMANLIQFIENNEQYRNLSPKDQALLRYQLLLMEGYLEVLEERIDNFT